jgi:ribonuclease HII
VILAGVDEAGYGPILGPLCTGLAAFRADGTADPKEADARLRRALDDGAHGLRFGDSKEVHRPGKPAVLETSVLALLGAKDGTPPANGAALLRSLGAEPAPGDHPWYAEVLRGPLPFAADPAAVAAASPALAAALAAAAIAPAVERQGNKAEVLFLEAAGIVERALEAAERAALPLEAVCDRQGARSRYAALLQQRFPARFVRVLGEGPKLSAYDLGGKPAPARARFQVKADASWVAVGVASMIAKYLREVHMAALNAWILREAPKVRPTAGYWTDGLRFLSQTAEARARLRVDDAVFVRQR